MNLKSSLLVFVSTLVSSIFAYAAPEILRFTADDVIYETEGEALSSILIAFNKDVNFSSIDTNDLLVEGISGDALGKTKSIQTVDKFELETEIAAFYYVEPINISDNGQYRVSIKAGEITGSGDPIPEIPAGELTTFNVAIEPPPAVVTVKGRAWLETEEPSLTDDGPEVDPGLDLYFRLEIYDSELQEFTFVNEFFHDGSPEGIGTYEFFIDSPGPYRVLTSMPFGGYVAPIPEWVIQTIGDPLRLGNPKDHAVYFNVDEVHLGSTFTYNFSYEEEHDSPEANLDDWPDNSLFIVWSGEVTSKGEPVPIGLPVLSNDLFQSSPNSVWQEASSEKISIVGVSDSRGITFNESATGGKFGKLQVKRPGSGQKDYIEYTPPYLGFKGDERFFYTIKQKSTTPGGPDTYDFGEVYVLVSPNNPGPRLRPVDDLIYIETEEAPSANDQYPVDVLANDLVDPEFNISGEEGSVEVIEQGQYGTFDFKPKPKDSDEQEGYYYTLENPPGPVSFVDQFTYRLKYEDFDFSETATVELNIFPSWRPPEGVESTGKAVTARTYSNASALQGLLDIFCSQLVFHLFTRGITQQSETLMQSDRNSIDTSFSSRGNAETEARTVKVFQDYLPGLVALVAGEGHTETISQEMIEDVKFLMNYVLERATPDLKAVIEREAQRFDGLDAFVGKNFNEWAEMLGMNPEEMGNVMLEPSYAEGNFSVKTYDVPNLVYTLWKSTDLDPENWEVVSEVVETTEDIKKVLTDPSTDLSSGRAFYRVTNELE